MFDTHEKRDKYKNYVDEFFENLSNIPKDDAKKINITQVRLTQIQIEIAGADSLIKDEKNKKALRALLEVVDKT